MGAVQAVPMRSSFPPLAFNFGHSGGQVAAQGGLVYYRDESPVNASVNDGSIAAGSNATLYGTQYLWSPAAVSSVEITTLDAPDLSAALIGPSAGNYRFLAGVIRNYNDGLGWRLINDGPHPAIGITSVDSLSDTSVITVNYPHLFGAGTQRTGTLIAVPDETLAQAGIFVGGSVAPTFCDLKLGRTGALSDYLTYSGSAWSFLRGNYTVTDSTNNTLTVSHTAVATQEKDDVHLLRRGNGPIPVLSSGTGFGVTTTFKIDWLDPITGAVLTTPTTAMQCLVSRGHTGLSVSPADVHIGVYPFSNIWLFGLHQEVV